MQYGVLWSLAVEEHFYLLWPAAVRSLSRHRVVIVAATICVLCPCLRAFYFVHGYNTGTGYTWLVAETGWRQGQCWPRWRADRGEHAIECGASRRLFLWRA